MQAEIGFGDAFAVEPEEIEFPTLLDMPKPLLRAYTKETALSEKFEAMITLGEGNSRMKDYFDVWRDGSIQTFILGRKPRRVYLSLTPVSSSKQ